MSNQYTPNLGQLCGEDARRDAVHIACAPILADCVLQPGTHVGVRDGVAVDSSPHVGIVDPFLLEDVQPGQRFWVFLYPGSITGLRHVWVHPAFKPRPPVREASHVS